MSFRFYTNMVSQASRNAAYGLFVMALFLIGFGVLIVAFSEIFAFLAAAVFIFAGFGLAGTAIKIYFAQRRMNKAMRNQEGEHRENVRIHIE